MNTNLQGLISRVRPEFSDTRLARFSEYEVRSKVEERIHHQRASVDLSRVVGTEHPDYFEHTWIELLGDPPGGASAHLKRISARLDDLNRDPEYYLRDDAKDHWSFYLIDGFYYVSSGMHRTVIGRFALECNGYPPIVDGVAVTELKFQTSPTGIGEELQDKHSNDAPWSQFARWIQSFRTRS